MTALWADLAGDARAAHAAVRAFAASPGRGVPFLARAVRPAAGVDPAAFRRLLTDLDSTAFAARERATRALAELGEDAEVLLRRALAGDLSNAALMIWRNLR